MKPGRELDALIAEKVMGVDPNEYYRDCPTCGYDGMWSSEGPKPYSTDLATAWEVVEKIKRTRGNDGTFKLQYFYDKWICYWDHEDFLSGSNKYPEAETAPLVICLAALKSVGVELTSES